MDDMRTSQARDHSNGDALKIINWPKTPMNHAPNHGGIVPSWPTIMGCPAVGVDAWLRGSVIRNGEFEAIPNSSISTRAAKMTTNFELSHHVGRRGIMAQDEDAPMRQNLSNFT